MAFTKLENKNSLPSLNSSAAACGPLRSISATARKHTEQRSRVVQSQQKALEFVAANRKPWVGVKFEKTENSAVGIIAPHSNRLIQSPSLMNPPTMFE